jgi:hypothetical protein
VTYLTFKRRFRKFLRAIGLMAPAPRRSRKTSTTTVSAS